MKDHVKYRQEFESDNSAIQTQRDLSNEEMRIVMVPGASWEGDWTNGYDNRAKMEFDRISDYAMRVYSEHCDNRISVNYSPDDDMANDDDASVLDGIYRRDVKRKGGQSSIDTAAFEQIVCGVGAVVLRTEYDDEEDEQNLRQNIVFDEQANAYSTVVWDRSAVRADKADASRCQILTSFSKERFKELWPDALDSSVTPDDRRVFTWTTNDLTYVVTRYHIEIKKTVIYTFHNPLALEGKGDTVKITESEFKEEGKALTRDGYKFVSKRPVKRRTVYKTVYNGAGILEKKTRVVGKYIPVIPFYGYRAFVDGEERYHGVVRKKIDPQRVLNMLVSLSAEAAATSHQTKHIFSPEQMLNPDVRRQWSGDLSQKAYLLAEPIYDENGNIIHAGPLGTVEGGGMTQAQAAQIGMVSEFLREGTGGAPQDIADPMASGKAINAVLKRVDMNTTILRDNRKKSMKHLGEVYRCMAAEIYSGKVNKGRKIKIVTERDETKDISLMSQQAGVGGVGYVNDLSKGKFEVLTDIGKDYATQAEETFEQLKDIYLSLLPQDPLRPLILGRMIQNMSGAGMSDIKEYLRRQELIQGVAKPETEEEQAFVQSLQNAPQQPDANQQYLMSEAEKNQAMTAKTLQDTRLSAAKTEETVAKAKQINVDTALKTVKAD